MSTVIYPSPIFGPVHSRRLGVSLGINLLPADGKCCTFDCIYCECGYNKDSIASIANADTIKTTVLMLSFLHVKKCVRLWNNV